MAKVTEKSQLPGMVAKHTAAATKHTAADQVDAAAAHQAAADAWTALIAFVDGISLTSKAGERALNNCLGLAAIAARATTATKAPRATPRRHVPTDGEAGFGRMDAVDLGYGN